MNVYTVIGYTVPDGGHCVEAIDADGATEAAMAIRQKLELTINEFEVIAVARGRLNFECIDASRVALANYSPISP